MHHRLFFVVLSLWCVSTLDGVEFPQPSGQCGMVAGDKQAAPSAVEVPVLNLPHGGVEADAIDFAQLPALRGEHAVINAARLGPHADAQQKVDMHHLRLNLHNYLVRFNNRFWCIWSDGPRVEDWPTQEVRYSTSEDGLHWTKARSVTGTPQAPHAFIARGLWVRNGQLLALAAHYRGKGAFGPPEAKQLQLQAYRYDREADWRWQGKLYDNAINNFPPQRLPNSKHWILTRRDSRFNVSMLIGGNDALDQWESYPVVRVGAVKQFRPDEPIFWPLADGSLYALFRDNGGSQRLFRSTSHDAGRTWAAPQLTNFPNATSKLFSLKASNGCRILILNANVKIGRRELHLAISRDDQTFTRLARLAVPSPPPLAGELAHLQKKFQSGIASLQYPHAMEHDGHIFIALSRGKVQIEVFRVRLHAIAQLAK